MPNEYTTIAPDYEVADEEHRHRSFCGEIERYEEKRWELLTRRQ